MSQDQPHVQETADKTFEPVIFYDPDPPAPLLGRFGIVLAIATFFYFFI